MTPDFHDVSVIVACRNEEANIEACLTVLLTAVPEAEIVVVDGGTDGTFAKARQMSQQWPQIKPVKNEPDLGKGHAIRKGIQRASGRVMAQFDADLQFFAADLPKLLAPIREGNADLAIGSRFLSGADRSAYRPDLFRNGGNWLLSAYVSTLIGRRVTDVTAGVKAWTREAIERIDFRDNRYSYEAEIVVRAARLGLRLVEIPVRYADRTAGVSMHRNTVALARAGAVIMLKVFAAWMRGGKTAG